jgi:hypothetical protein
MLDYHILSGLVRAGWPKHLPPFKPGRHRARVCGAVTFLPHDHTRSRVKSYVALTTSRYLGVVSTDGGRPFHAIRECDGRSAFPRSLDEAAEFLAAVPERHRAREQRCTA